MSAPAAESELVSIIIPCRNEQAFIQSCLRSVLAFECPSTVDFEVIVMDGQSEDTSALLVKKIAEHDSRIRLFDNPGRIQSTAVNLGIGHSRGQYIMRLDAHARYPSNYLKLCYETSLRSGAQNVGGLFITQPSAQTYSAQLVQALTTHRFGVGNAGYRIGAPEDFADTVPYGFFRREVFDALGWLDERLVRAQDYEFNRRIIAAGGKILRNPQIHVLYYNQPTLRRFFSKQFFREAPYNAYLWYVAPYAFAARHGITAVFAAGVILGIVGSFISPWISRPFAAVMALYFSLALAAAIQQALHLRNFWHIFCLPYLFFWYHFTHGLGVLHGLLRLATMTAPVQKTREPWPGAGFVRVPVQRLKLNFISSSQANK